MGSPDVKFAFVRQWGTIHINYGKSRDITHKMDEDVFLKVEQKCDPEVYY